MNAKRERTKAKRTKGAEEEDEEAEKLYFLTVFFDLKRERSSLAVAEGEGVSKLARSLARAFDRSIIAAEGSDREKPKKEAE
jgi:hypothetical protein